MKFSFTRDLRVRFGVILALALLPLLIFSAWQSYYDYQRDETARRAQLTFVAKQSVASIVDTIDTAKSVLRTVEETVDAERCRAQLQKVLAEFDRFDEFVILKPTGEVECSANPRDVLYASVRNLKHLTPQKPFHTLGLEAKSPAGNTKPLLIITYGDYNGDQLNRILLIAVNLNRVSKSSIGNDVGMGARAAVINSKGDFLSGDLTEAGEIKLRGIDLENMGVDLMTEYRDTQGEMRDLYLVASRENHIYIAYSTVSRDLWSWSFVNPLSSLLVPLVAWIFGFVAIWVATEQMILTHLRKLRSAAHGFADGDKDRRVGTLDNPPHTIHALANTFDNMADEISAREDELLDGLAEKETLLREIHHRVKNNLQIIISLMNMQERKLSDPQSLAAIVEIRSRINAIALVHKGLYENEDLRFVNIQVFLDRLIKEFSRANGTDKLGISISNTSDCEPMEAETALPVALFVVEAMTNCIKHGVPNGGKITVAVKQTDQLVNVKVQDNGQSKMPSTDEEQTGTGKSLIKGFARQLGGEATFGNGPEGYDVTLSFPIRIKYERE